MMYQDVVRSRRSVRDFMPDVEIPKEELMAIIEEAMFAPNSTNLNSWRFLIVTEKEQWPMQMKSVLKMSHKER